MADQNGCRTLFGLKAILQYLEVSEPKFKAFIEWGMPARVINGRWYAHKDNIDEYFKQITRYRETNFPDGAE